MQIVAENDKRHFLKTRMINIIFMFLHFMQNTFDFLKTLVKLPTYKNALCKLCVYGDGLGRLMGYVLPCIDMLLNKENKK